MLGRDQPVFGRKSSFTGGLSSAGGATGKAGQMRCRATTGIGAGRSGLEAQAVSASASSGKAGATLAFVGAHLNLLF